VAKERVLFRATLRQLATVEETIAGIEAEILGRLKDDPGDQHLLTLPGVGPLTAATIWASIGDPSRFSSAREVARYAGLDPSVMQSGQIDRRGHISKNGSRRLRTALVEAAYSVVRHALGSLGQFGRRLAAGKGPAKTACAVVRKLLVLAWRLMLRREDDRTVPSHRIQAKRREVKRRAERQPSDVNAAVNPHWAKGFGWTRTGPNCDGVQSDVRGLATAFHVTVRRFLGLASCVGLCRHLGILEGSPFP